MGVGHVRAGDLFGAFSGQFSKSGEFQAMLSYLKAFGRLGAIVTLILLLITLVKQLIALVSFLLVAIKIAVVVAFVGLMLLIVMAMLRSRANRRREEEEL